MNRKKKNCLKMMTHIENKERKFRIISRNVIYPKPMVKRENQFGKEEVV